MTHHHRRTAVAAVAAAATLALAPSGTPAATRDAPSDFDADGYSDLVVPSPTDVTSVGSGGVYVVPGSSRGLVPGSSRLFTFADPVVGAVTTTGDFDGDGFDDLALTSEPGYAPDSFAWTGNVRVLYGSPTGLSRSRVQLLAPGTSGIPQTDTELGTELSAGDHDGDGDDELAVSSSQDVWVFDGSGDGLADEPTGLGHPASALATGDVDGDGFDDLAVGRSDAGYLTILPGTAGGLSPSGRRELSRDDLQQTGSPSPVEIVVGDFGRGPQADVAVSGNLSDRVSVVYGTDDGVTTTRRQVWDRTTLASIPGAAQATGRFGTVMAAADMGYSAFDDLAVGAFQERVKTAEEAGSVTVLVGTADGLVAAHGRRWTQETSGVPGAAERGDWFGEALVPGLFTASSKSGLAVSASEEAIGTRTRAGGVNVLHGSSTGLTTSGSSFLTQDTPGMTGVVEKDDRMGARGPFTGEEGH